MHPFLALTTGAPKATGGTRLATEGGGLIRNVETRAVSSTIALPLGICKEWIMLLRNEPARRVGLSDATEDLRRCGLRMPSRSGQRLRMALRDDGFRFVALAM